MEVDLFVVSNIVCIGPYIESTRLWVYVKSVNKPIASINKGGQAEFSCSIPLTLSSSMFYE